MIKVTNRSDGSTGYTIPELSIKRIFAPNQTLEIEEEELNRLQFQPGGTELINRFFKIEDKEIAQQISPLQSNEPEYWYDNEKIIEILQSGSRDEFLDFFDFAPVGAIELMKTIAVQLPLTDTGKMQIIKDKTGLNVQKAIENYKDNIEVKVEKKPSRRVSTQSNSPTRRTNK